MTRPMRKHEEIVTFRIPRRLTGRRLVLVDAAELARLRARISGLEVVVTRIRRGERELREGRTRVVRSLSELRT